LKSKTAYMVVGVLLIVIALIFGAVRYFSMYDFGIAYGSGNGWYFYGLFGVIGLIGIILAAWSLMKTEAPAEAAKPAQ
jgi:hypothetical protein